MDRPMTKRQQMLADMQAKIDHEGGMEGIFSWGGSSFFEDASPEIHELAAKAEEALADFDAAWRQLLKEEGADVGCW